jgi:hypothetical protein
LDPLPQFFLGDSFSYLCTAIKGWIPGDRSFVYGFMIRGLTFFGHSLTPLVIAQCMASLGTCLLVFYVVRTHFGLSARLATAAACWCALDPMQLYYERAVMTEAFSTFGFALCIATALRYVAQPRVGTLALLALSCMLPISLRVTFVLPALGICLLPPLYVLVAQWLHPASNTPQTAECRTRLRTWNPQLTKYLGHVAVAGFCTFALNYGYCCLHGKAGNPRYVYDDGLFLIAGLAPVITPADATDDRVAAVIASADATHLRDRDSCAAHLFSPGELVDRLHNAIPDHAECSMLAKAAAKNAVWRAPLQAAMLGWNTWRDYFSYGKMEERLVADEGGGGRLNEQERQLLQDRFELVVSEDWGLRLTVVKWLHLHQGGLIYVLLAAPFLGIAATWGGWNKNPVAILLLLLSTVGLLITTCMFSYPVLRYLHPFGFIAPIFLAVVLDQIMVRCRKHAAGDVYSHGRLQNRPHFGSHRELTPQADPRIVEETMRLG